MSPRQGSLEFRNQQQRSLIGFGIYFKKENKIECVNFDIISDLKTQNGLDSVNAFR
jgi:hypothetical protein